MVLALEATTAGTTMIPLQIHPLESAPVGEHIVPWRKLEQTLIRDIFMNCQLLMWGEEKTQVDHDDYQGFVFTSLRCFGTRQDRKGLQTKA
jgi:hypothetical protein